jgi:DNA-3-methyladenine glycosylase I
MTIKNRCSWVSKDQIYIDYHDEEWGVPLYNDQKLFEFLILEGAQAGLSWITVLKRRANYQKLVDNFDIEKIANYSDSKLESLLKDSRIIRNRLKVYSMRKNALATLKIINEFGSLSEYLWGFVDNKPIQNHWLTATDAPATTMVSDAMSKDMKKRGFSFVGSTICYAFMQAVGMVNDHSKDCFCYAGTK